jgi:hypothetical protein
MAPPPHRGQPARPLAGLRVAATVPPRRWFYGLARQYATLYAQTLRDLGAVVHPVPVAPFTKRSLVPAGAVVAAARRFRPDLAIGLHDASYALYCTTRREGSEHGRANLFAEALDVPTILLWDHAPLQAASILLRPLARSPEDSHSGSIAALRSALAPSRYLHVVRDSGHRDLLDALGIVSRERIRVETAFAHPAFATQATAPAPPPLAEVAFFGHLQPPAGSSDLAGRHPALAALREQVLAGRTASLDRPVLPDIAAGLAELPVTVRAALRADPDESFYWHLLGSEVAACQARLRAEVLAGACRPVAFFGETGGVLLGGAIRRHPGRFRFGQELAQAFAATQVTVDVVNPGFVHGFGTKAVNCFAAGGFMLLDRRRDFVAAYGEAGEAVSCSSLDELNAKLERYLAAPRERREIGDALATRIRQEHLLPGVLVRLVEQALALPG